MTVDTPPLSAASLGTASARDRLVGRRILIVGAGTQPSSEDAPVGNGRAISVLCAREGADVALADRDEAAVTATAELIASELTASKEATTTVHLADVSDAAACERLVAEAAEALGGLDGVVINVGIGAGTGLADTSIEQWDAVTAVNLRAHFAILKAVSPLLEPGASVVLTGSVAAIKPGTNIPAYDATKAGLAALMRHAAAEFARRGIRANMVVPGLIDTPLGRAARGGAPAQAHLRVPLQREGTAWEVAQATVWLLSDESAYITGHQLVVDGGLTTLA